PRRQPSMRGTPAVIHAKPGEKEFWRLANTSANTILEIELNYDGKPQKLDVVALDGVPTGSQDGTRLGKPVKDGPPASPHRRTRGVHPDHSFQRCEEGCSSGPRSGDGARRR